MPKDVPDYSPAPDAEKDLRALIAGELVLQLSAPSDAAPPASTQAGRLIQSFIRRGIESGDCRGLRYLTDLVGFGAGADIRREQVRLARERNEMRRQAASRDESSGTVSAEAQETFQNILEILQHPVPTRTFDDIFREDGTE